VEEIAKTKKTDFDVLITTPDMMRELSKLAKILGPKGLMPNPKTDTMVTNPVKAVKEIAAGKVTFKNDNTSNIHVAVGKVSFDQAKLEENINTFIQALHKTKPETSKGTFVKAMYLNTTMGPSIKFHN
jgi:large subunit ribosomal protein L1